MTNELKNEQAAVQAVPHTPGPWIRKGPDQGHIAYGDGTRFVAFTAIPRLASEDRNDGESWLDMRERTAPERAAIAAEQVANARLIAAAPELLAALRNLTQAIDAASLGDPVHRIGNYAVAVAAIAKATGAAA